MKKLVWNTVHARRIKVDTAVLTNGRNYMSRVDFMRGIKRARCHAVKPPPFILFVLLLLLLSKVQA